MADLERVAGFLAPEGGEASANAIETIAEAVELLAHHPLIGRPIENDLRELIISRGKTGYVALYDFIAAQDVVIVLAIRHQRELGQES